MRQNQSSALKEGQGGFSLLETLLAVGLSALLTAYLVNSMQGWAEIERARTSASYIGTMSGAMGEMVGSLVHFDTLYNEVEAVGGAVQIGILASEGFPISLENGAWNGAERILPGSSQITEGYVNFSPFREGFAIVAATSLSGPSAGERTLEIVLASRAPVPERVAREAAAKLGAGGGVISVLSVNPANECLPAPTGCAGTLRSVFNDWRVDLNRFAGTPWAISVAANPPSAENAYIVFYKRLTQSESAGDYLYRVPISNVPEANRMRTDLDMARNSLVGVDNIRLGTIDITHSASVEGSAAVNGEFNASSLIANGEVQAGAIRMVQSYNPDPRLDEAYGGRTTRTVTVDGDLSAPSVSVANLTVSTISVPVFESNVVQAGEFSHNNPMIVNTISAADLSAADIYAGEFSIQELDVENLSVTNLTINNATVESLSATSLNGNIDSGSTSIGVLTSCGGCN